VDLSVIAAVFLQLIFCRNLEFLMRTNVLKIRRCLTLFSKTVSLPYCECYGEYSCCHIYPLLKQ